MSKRIVILNGPPGSGKDTLGAALSKVMACSITQFKFDLYKATADYFDIGLDEFIKVASDRNTKEIKSIALGLSPREALIHVSEHVYKPRHGRDYFGRLAHQRVMSVDTLDPVVFTDGGFPEEAMVFALAGHPVTTIQLMGRGTFEGDSRDYIHLNHPLCRTYQLHLVEGEIDQAVSAVQALLKAV